LRRTRAHFATEINPAHSSVGPLITTETIANTWLEKPPNFTQNLGSVACEIRFWRRGRDSNSRGPCGPSGFQDRCNQPLCHLSALINSTTYVHSIRPRRPFRGSMFPFCFHSEPLSQKSRASIARAVRLLRDRVRIGHEDLHTTPSTGRREMAAELYVSLALHLKHQEQERKRLQRLIDLGLPLATVARIAGQSPQRVERLLRGDWRAGRGRLPNAMRCLSRYLARLDDCAVELLCLGFALRVCLCRERISTESVVLVIGPDGRAITRSPLLRSPAVDRWRHARALRPSLARIPAGTIWPWGTTAYRSDRAANASPE
jgi:hypothetical protein